MDKDTWRGRRLDYARICMEIEYNFDFPPTMNIYNPMVERIEMVAMEYEWKQAPCCHCETLSHMESVCVVATLAKGKEKLDDLDDNRVASGSNGSATTNTMEATHNNGGEDGDIVGMTTRASEGSANQEEVVGSREIVPASQDQLDFP